MTPDSVFGYPSPSLTQLCWPAKAAVLPNKRRRHKKNKTKRQHTNHLKGQFVRDAAQGSSHSRGAICSRIRQTPKRKPARSQPLDEVKVDHPGPWGVFLSATSARNLGSSCAPHSRNWARKTETKRIKKTLFCSCVGQKRMQATNTTTTHVRQSPHSVPSASQLRGKRQRPKEKGGTNGEASQPAARRTTHRRLAASGKDFTPHACEWVARASKEKNPPIWPLPSGPARSRETPRELAPFPQVDQKCRTFSLAKPKRNITGASQSFPSSSFPIRCV
ncbi:hypothetical protein QBC35DRAFT_283978 [Podospora australis]|uniref:Uncharacterized protein n=1 Tax=Podospora australis TaxID=1536484 RepID=A0AAN7AGU9_9PEZI|nr:hypothetical protein QBC35DRAFT_283978 [Podospora australis]